MPSTRSGWPGRHSWTWRWPFHRGSTAAGVHFEASLAEKGRAQKDRLLVYAFRSEDDFRLVRDSLDDAGGDARKIEPLLEARLRGIPAHRWKKRIVTYEILPR